MDSVGGTQALTAAPGANEAPASAACPRCTEPHGALYSADTGLLDGLLLCRCARCGVRFVADPPSRPVAACAACGLPFLNDEPPDRQRERCVDCREGRIPDDLPEDAVVEAAEQEIRAAVASGWRFAFSPGSSAYLNRLAERIARHVEGAPARPRVVLIDEPSLTTLALPSGLMLISVGTLEALQDEAELVFVLGHELVHAAGGEAAHRLVRLGLTSVTRDADACESRAWLDAVRDTISLGYGRARERDADARSLQAFLALGYDPNSILRYLDRLDARIGAGDPAVRELALAHPTPADRMRQVTRILHGLTGSLPANVNREVFRRAVLGVDLDPCTLDEADGVDREGGRPAAGGSRWLWTGIGIALLAALILLVGILLGG